MAILEGLDTLRRSLGAREGMREVWEVQEGAGNRDEAAGASERCQGIGSNILRDGDTPRAFWKGKRQEEDRALHRS
jgi:hypothetical protein